jgi:hypothetical protein
MSTNQRKSALLVNYIYLLYYPGLRGMASFAIKTNRTPMDIFMTGETILSFFSFRKNERLMAGFTFYFAVLTGEGKPCNFMIELH